MFSMDIVKGLVLVNNTRNFLVQGKFEVPGFYAGVFVPFNVFSMAWCIPFLNGAMESFQPKGNVRSTFIIMHIAIGYTYI